MTPTPPIPIEIITAILKTQTECGQLGKGDFNAHGKYNFVSIDNYYEKVARVATGNGLTWVARVVESVPFGEKGLSLTYEFDVVHASGACAPGYMRHPVLHPIQGAQTAGSALSYADKIFMRSTFKIVTGEHDADATDPHALDPITMPPARSAPRTTPPPANDAGLDLDGPETGPAETQGDDLVAQVKRIASGVEDGKPVLRAAASKADLELIEEVFTKFVVLCETMAELKRFWNQNSAALDSVAKHDEPRHERIKDAFMARRTLLETKA